MKAILRPYGLPAAIVLAAAVLALGSQLPHVGGGFGISAAAFYLFANGLLIVRAVQRSRWADAWLVWTPVAPFVALLVIALSHWDSRAPDDAVAMLIVAVAGAACIVGAICLVSCVIIALNARGRGKLAAEGRVVTPDT